MKKITVYSAILAFLSVWIGWTVLVDFVVAPTIFRTIHDFFNAGELGMKVFTKLNYLEFIIGTILSIFILYSHFKYFPRRLFIVLSLILVSIIGFYIFSLCPKIIELTELWKLADTKGVIGMNGIADIQQEHQFYHGLYIKLDSLKLFILISFISILFWERHKWQQ